MTFVLSKLAWAVAAPGNLLVLLLALGTLLLFAGGRRARPAGRALVAAVLAGLLACAVLPVGRWLGAPLEDRFPPPALPARVDGIVVLGGAVEPALAASRGEPSVNEAAERLLAFAALARRYPGAELVASGGSAAVWDDRHREDAAARGALAQAGIDTDRVVFERQSRNTWENALFSRRIVEPQPGETWLLVTSAAHMPRAVGVFRRLDWPVIPYPVDYRTFADGRDPLAFDVAEGLQAVNGAAREWVGLAAYRLLGRTDALFPGP
ncbi:YdcF family protein [Azospirillum sp. A39]|uniref:YdcF family protein n=1 Tax=Azospirillum sp. A39 TaxID=3462279 RepID=UPI0040461459